MNYRKWGLALLVLALVWRTSRYFLVFPMWGDEAFVAVNFYLRDFAGLTETLEHDMVVPLGVLWSTFALSELIGKSEWALRMLPFIAGIASLFFFRRFAARVLSERSALAAFAIFAASYYPMRHAAEVKPYAIDLLVALVLLIAAHRRLCRPENRGSLATFALCSVVGVWFSYTAAFVAGGAHLVLIAQALSQRKRANVILGIASGSLLLASFAAMYLFVGIEQQWEAAPSETGQWARHFPPLSEPWRLPRWLVHAHTGNMFAYPNGGRDYGSAATTLLFIIGGVALWRRGQRKTVALLLACFPLMLLAAALGKYPYGGSARTNLHVAPAICLLAGEGLVVLFGRLLNPSRAAIGLRAFCALMMVTILAMTVQDFVQPYKRLADLRCRQFGVWLANASAPGDAWVVFGDFRSNDGPDLREWGGSAARFRYHLLDKSRGPLLFATTAHELTELESSGIWVLAYQDEEEEFPQVAWDRYRAELVGVLGEPATASIHAFERMDEKVRVVQFQN